jgi:hypothetical protein
MRICKYSVPSPWWIKLLMCLLIIMQVACSSAAEKTELADWVELSFLIDGMIEIQLKVPPVKIGKELNKMQFIGTKDESPESLFIASYDPGRGRDRDLLLIRISGVVVHVERENEDGVGLSLEEIKNKIYLSRSNANQDFEFIGDQNFTGRSWLRVNLIGGYRKGVAYSTPIQDEYVLILMMSMYGEKSSKTKLFSHRHETLKEVVKSVRISSIND